jgi:hypothetical protein
MLQGSFFLQTFPIEIGQNKFVKSSETFTSFGFFVEDLEGQFPSLSVKYS